MCSHALRMRVPQDRPKYIRSNYGGIQKFLDDYSIYGISNRGGETYVHLLVQEVKDFDIHDIHRRITKESDWIII